VSVSLFIQTGNIISDLTQFIQVFAWTITRRNRTTQQEIPHGLHSVLAVTPPAKTDSRLPANRNKLVAKHGASIWPARPHTNRSRAVSSCALRIILEVAIKRGGNDFMNDLSNKTASGCPDRQESESYHFVIEGKDDLA
jgi:hypothetical protein